MILLFFLVDYFGLVSLLVLSIPQCVKSSSRSVCTTSDLRADRHIMHVAKLHRR